MQDGARLIHAKLPHEFHADFRAYDEFDPTRTFVKATLANAQHACGARAQDHRTIDVHQTAARQPYTRCPGIGDALSKANGIEDRTISGT